MESLRGLKQMVIHINGHPVGLRLLSYLFLLVLLSLLVVSVIVVAIAAWGFLDSILSGNFHLPSVDEDSEWGLR